MGEPDAAGAQRVDLLGGIGQETGNEKGARGANGGRTQARQAPPVLLDRLYPPHGQGNQSFSEMGVEQAIEKNSESVIVFIRRSI